MFSWRRSTPYAGICSILYIDFDTKRILHHKRESRLFVSHRWFIISLTLFHVFSVSLFVVLNKERMNVSESGGLAIALSTVWSLFQKSQNVLRSQRTILVSPSRTYHSHHPFKLKLSTQWEQLSLILHNCEYHAISFYQFPTLSMMTWLISQRFPFSFGRLP